MPPIRTLSSAAKPVKTERTHEENQERAYIAASRRSDRSLEARIESARRASEIHKKRTGRGLRVTEQDVVNEEMYEEEDDDLPTQYQRLSAHLQSGSLNFNRKLHDYIATQTAVRNGFLRQYSSPLFPAYPNQYGPPTPQSPSAGNPFMGHQQQMLPPQMLPQSPQVFAQHQQAPAPQQFTEFPQQNYRQGPYTVPQRPQSHQRSASIPTPQQMPGYQQLYQQPSSSVTSPNGGDEHRRMSLPPTIDQSTQQGPDGQHRPALSRTTTSQSVKQASSPQKTKPSTASSTPPSGRSSPSSQPENTAPPPHPYMNSSTASQVLNMNPLSMSLPPESQQFVGSALDPNDPATSIFMAGSDNLPQPFRGTYTYNPNLSPKVARTASANTSAPGSTFEFDMNPTLPSAEMARLDTNLDGYSSNNPASAMSDNFISPLGTANGIAYDMGSFGDHFQSVDFSTADDFNSSDFFNFE
ncbi:hypothetical protein K491DRAFT_588564 [Lophiostoma macrostomum CBS 122681]|uniref:Uncharacterized protein n=1 Tax=Lophiostoma macrostomum CBS 122681 TaxID=1314788 RepID=A0A6A6TLN3_9PLEO|nr:hypothetical protein K491DRAFT_588564 [Lophiostoma macrostomum CBS 122681]